MDKTRSKLLKIAIFGGSFDPPHLGHCQLVSQVLASGVVDEIWLMPAFISPLKNSVAPAADRLAMCRFLEREKIKVSDLEIKRGGKSYTLVTTGELKKRFKTYKFYWLIGTDLLGQLDKWYKFQELLKEIEFLVFPRKINISSSKIRERVKKGQSVADLVPKEAEEYIRKHKLYC